MPSAVTNNPQEPEGEESKMKKRTYEITADVKSNGMERRRVVDVDADTTEEAIQIARDMRPNATLLNVKARRLEPDEDVLNDFWKKYEGTQNLA